MMHGQKNIKELCRLIPWR